MNVHHKCQKKVANLCGINQKLLAEALNQVSQVGRCPGNSGQRVAGSGDSRSSHLVLGNYNGGFYIQDSTPGRCGSRTRQQRVADSLSWDISY